MLHAYSVNTHKLSEDILPFRVTATGTEVLVICHRWVVDQDLCECLHPLISEDVLLIIKSKASVSVLSGHPWLTGWLINPEKFRVLLAKQIFLGLFWTDSQLSIPLAVKE